MARAKTTSSQCILNTKGYNIMDIREFEEASQRMRHIIHQFPLARSETFSHMSGADIWLKCENQQKTGSFKVRGAYNKMARLRESGWAGGQVVACSAGNHAQGVAYAARQLGYSATIVMPKTAPLAKVAATEGYGATVELCGDVYDDTYGRALEIRERTDAVLIPPFDDDDVIAGQGAIGFEVLRDLPAVDAVLVPCGGGGLLAGMATCIKRMNPRVRVIGVQAAGADAVVRSFAAGQWRGSDTVSTIADGIAVRMPGKRTVELILQYVDDMVTVSDAEIAEAILLLIERCKQVVEPAGAVAVAAALNRRVDLAGKKAVCVLSGGNIDVAFIQRIIQRGLAKRGRHLQFHTTVTDRPGSLQRFCNIISEQGGNILAMEHNRLGAELGLGEAVLHIALEVGGSEHGQRLVDKLEQSGYRIVLD